MTPTTSSTPPASTGRDSDQMALRLPTGMRASIKALAATNRRTMNAELLVLIERGMAGASVVTELTKAEQIILVLLAALTPEQKLAVHAKLDAAGLSGEGMTRYHERRAAITAAGAA